MANVFVHSGVAITADAPANRRAWNEARISSLSEDDDSVQRGKRIPHSPQTNRLQLLIWPSVKSSILNPVKNSVKNLVLNRSQTEHHISLRPNLNFCVQI